jgi:hypothetical protein
VKSAISCGHDGLPPRADQRGADARGVIERT